MANVTPSRRLARINELIRQELGQLLSRELRDPRLAQLVSITATETSPDLSLTKVYVSVMGSEEEKRTSLNVLQGARGFLRRELAMRLRLRHVPEIAFHLDESIERGERILRLLREL